MNKQFKTVGRWLVAGGLMVGALSVLDVPQAHAGHWEILPLPMAPNTDENSPEYQQWLNQEFIPRFPGQFDIKEYGFPNSYSQSYGIDQTPEMLREGLERTLGGRDSQNSNAPVQGMGRNGVYPHGGVPNLE